ncbi:MAG: FAD-dependent thymidylate synthase [Thermoplasmata archaeon]|nr:FAD-dependent thymidylate synthase [Thermoplasmata archaeon]
MKVELIAYTPEPDIIAAVAAKLTHSKSEIDELLNDDKEKLKKLLKIVIRMGHTSVVEHAYFTFAISGVSRSLTHQLVRHRIASYSQQSQRYVEQNMEYVTPPSILKDEELKKKYDRMMKEIWEFYEYMKDRVPVEDARYVLPNAAHTKIIVSMNARSLLNFFELRCCLHAQWEIRKLAWRMLHLVRKVAPIIFEDAGPPCMTKGYCPMNKKDCVWYPERMKKRNGKNL